MKLFGKDEMEPRIIVRESLRGAHKLVSLAKEELEKGDTDENRLIVPQAESGLSIYVSKSSLRRALLIMDAVIKGLEDLGHEVTPGPTARISGVDIGFTIVEQVQSSKEEPKEHDLEGRYEFGHSRFSRKMTLSGRLTLRICEMEARWAQGCHKAWRDGKKRKLEDKLGSFVSGLAKLAIQKKEYELLLEEKKRQDREEELRRKERAERRAERRALVEEERKRVRGLIKEAKNWERSREIEKYIRARMEQYRAEHGEIEEDSELGRWVQWAEDQAARINPLVQSPQSILDEEIEDEEEEDERPYWWFLERE